MDVYELKLKVYLLSDIKQEEALNKIASFIDETLSKSAILLEFHQNNQYKNYNFCSFYPVAKDGVYCSNNMYTIVIRTIDFNLGQYLSLHLADHYNRVMKGIVCDKQRIPFHPIEKVYSLTPVILKDQQGYWKDHLSFNEFEERIKSNLIKKYNVATNSKIDEDFTLYHSMKLINRTPIKVPYKNITLLGDKVEIQVAKIKIAQELIYMSLGTGLGESNARGNGFINYQYFR